MACKNCGYLIDESQEICPYCGHNQKEEVEFQEQNPILEPLKVEKEVTFDDYPVFSIPKLEEKGKTKKNKWYLFLIPVIIIFLIFSLEKTIKSPDVKKEESNETVTHSGYIFEIPKNYNYYNSLSGLTITDKEETWAAIIQVSSKTYVISLRNQDQIKKQYEDQGFKVIEIKETNILDTSYLTLSLEKENHNLMIALRSAPLSDSFILMVSKKDNQIDLNILNEIEPILKNVKAREN